MRQNEPSLRLQRLRPAGLCGRAVRKQEEGGGQPLRKDRPSRTALRVASSRAAHQILDEPRILEDPLAMRIIGVDASQEILGNRQRHQTLAARYLRAFVVARSRVAEDTLARAVAQGVRQYVVLGAGLDTFACRNPHGDALQVFEVDHPATQTWKRSRLAGAGIATPGSLVFVPIDFESQTLPGQLRAAGFRPEAPAFFSWLGVSMYLTRDTVFNTLRYVVSLPAGSGIVFDYAPSLDTLSLARRLIVRTVMLRVAAAGEPWRTFFDPRRLPEELRALGFAAAEDIGPGALNAQFFDARADGLRVGQIPRLLRARV
jgi:methyltransferase (TIGR00027 family)